MAEVPRWFKVTAIIALVWNLLGCMAYLMDVMMTPEQVAALTPAQQAMMNSRPAWSIAATAIAVWFGALGSLGLILRKKWAMPLLALSLLGVLGQDLWLFVLSGALATAGMVAAVLQSVVLCFAVWLLVMARRMIAAGWAT